MCRLMQLPLPCIMNSRYLTPEHLDGLVQAIGFTIVKTRWKIGGKMAYWLMRKAAATPSVSGNTSAYSKKTELRKGKRNNFAILL